MRKTVLFTLMGLILFSSFAIAAEKKDPLAAWQPDFDSSSAEYTYLLSCVGHPAIEGVAAGFKIRDKVWEKSNGRLYVDFRPLSQLGGEKDVINKLKLGAVHGMMSSSVAAANIAPRLGIVNLPYVVDTFAKLDQFRNTPRIVATVQFRRCLTRHPNRRFYWLWQLRLGLDETGQEP